MVLLSGVYDTVIFFFQAEDGIRDYKVTGVQTCALPIYRRRRPERDRGLRRLPDALPALIVRDAVPGAEEGLRLRAVEDLRDRSEERRVGKECRSRWSPYH